MWYGKIFMEDSTSLEQFEKAFYFNIPLRLKEFLYDCNGALARDVYVKTEVALRAITSILDFQADLTHPNRDSAWTTNRRLRPVLTAKRIAIARAKNHYLCLEREWRQQRLVIWNCLTREFEVVESSIDEFLNTYT